MAVSGNLLEKFGLLASSLNDAQQTVIYHRSGLDGPVQTLQEVASIIGATRERVRQIQKKASETLVSQSNLGIEIRSHIDEVRKGMVVPLKISSLPTYDVWFKGCDKNPSFFEFILDLFQCAESHKSANYIISSYKDLGIILKGDVDTLGPSVRDLIEFIKNNLNTGITKAQIKEKIENIAAVDSPELVDFIFYEVIFYS
jgi:transcriptional regulator